jgi:DNA mismatch repair ATPase MutL
MPKIRFTVDAALLRELGERLVGQPHVALAELIKNAYDADASSVEVRIESNRIEVSDNGHGMDLSEFKRFWMRIGSPTRVV